MTGAGAAVLEVAMLTVRPGAQRAFERDFDKVSRLMAGVEGCLGHELRRSVGREGHYALLIEWRALQDRTRGFQQSHEFQRWRELLQAHLQCPPEVEHFHPPRPPALHHVTD